VQHATAVWHLPLTLMALSQWKLGHQSQAANCRPGLERWALGLGPQSVLPSAQPAVLAIVAAAKRPEVGAKAMYN